MMEIIYLELINRIVFWKNEKRNLFLDIFFDEVYYHIILLLNVVKIQIEALVCRNNLVTTSLDYTF